MLLLVGLGNPGPTYAKNRHNIGFMTADAIAERHGFGPFREKFSGEIADGNVGGHRTLMLKPTTYMNDSGRAVLAAMSFYKFCPVDIIVFHDEIDLAAGKLRVKRGGGHAGHNGLRSIHGQIGADYARLRMGVGHPGEKDRVAGHVLNDFSKSDSQWLDPLIAAVAEHVGLLMDGKDGDFMTQVSRTITPPKPKPGPEDNSKDVT